MWLAKVVGYEVAGNLKKETGSSWGTLDAEKGGAQCPSLPPDNAIFSHVVEEVSR